MRSWPEAFAPRASRTRSLHALACAGALCAGAAQAQDFQVHGFADLRLVSSADDASWTHGALGKTRYGDGDGLRFGAAALNFTWQAAPALLLLADVRAQPQDHARLGIVEAFARYRPV